MLTSKSDFLYEVYDDDFPIRRFLSLDSARQFIINKPHLKIKKIQHIDWNNYEPCLF